MYFSRREDPISSPKTHARVQLGCKVDRVAERVVKNASTSVTIDGLMMRIVSVFSNPATPIQLGPLQGVQPLKGKIGYFPTKSSFGLK